MSNLTLPLGDLAPAKLARTDWETKALQLVEKKVDADHKLRQLERADYVCWWRTALGMYPQGLWQPAPAK